jgi:hypothetical protein
MADTKFRKVLQGEGGTHRDGVKPRLADYFPPDLLWHVGEIAAENCRETEDYPEGKYPDLEDGQSNYRAGILVMKLLDSVWRHFLKVLMGEDLDDESGRPHIAHMICDLGMAHWTIMHRPDMDNRRWVPELAEEQDLVDTLDAYPKESR